MGRVAMRWENEIGVDIFWGCDRICLIANNLITNNLITNSLVSEQFDSEQFMCRVVRCEAV